MEDFYDFVSDMDANLGDIELTIEYIWTSGEVMVPDEYAEAFEKATRHLGIAKELISKIYLDLFKKHHDED